MTRSLTALLLCSALAACAPETVQDAPTVQDTTDAQPVAETSAAQVPTLTQAWLLDGFDSPESVIVADGGYYVSNVGGGGTDVDGNGAISRIGADGQMVERDWITGTDAMPLNAPKGMTLMDGGERLLITDIDHLVVADVKTGEILERIPADGAGFLNDVAEGPDGLALISDSRNARIYQYDGDGISVWLEDEALGGVNGLMMEGGRLLVTTMGGGELLSVDPASKAITVLAGGMANGDGVGRRADGSYMVSSWPGQLWHVREGEAPTLLLDTTVETVGEDAAVAMNDVLFLQDVVVAPNWSQGTVRAYRID
jgi:hypothetical protein